MLGLGLSLIKLAPPLTPAGPAGPADILLEAGGILLLEDSSVVDLEG
jgi:hypothetical protein